MSWRMQESAAATMTLTGLGAAMVFLLSLVLIKLDINSDVAIYSGGAISGLGAYLICCQIFPLRQMSSI